MSRYRDERDDDDYGARRDYYDDARERRARGGYYGARGAEPFDSAYGERALPRRETRDAREYRDERGARDYRDYRDRDYSRTDFETGAVGRRGERYDYERGARRGGDDDGRGYERPDGHDGRGEREGRSSWEEGREYYARRGRARTSRSHLRCRDIMTRDVTVATRETTLEEVARMMRDEDTGVIPVVERAQTAPSHTDASTTATDANAATGASTMVASAGSAPPTGESPQTRRISAGVHGNGRLVGLITDRDIVVRALAEGRDARTTRAEEIMTAEVHTAQPNDRVIDAVRKMGDKQVRRIPVVDRDSVLRGIISMADVALETDDDRELAEALEEISSGQSFWNRIFG